MYFWLDCIGVVVTHGLTAYDGLGRQNIDLQRSAISSCSGSVSRPVSVVRDAVDRCKEQWTYIRGWSTEWWLWSVYAGHFSDAAAARWLSAAWSAAAAAAAAAVHWRASERAWITALQDWHGLVSAAVPMLARCRPTHANTAAATQQVLIDLRRRWRLQHTVCGLYLYRSLAATQVDLRLA